MSTFQPEPFRTSKGLKWLASATPRFGHSADQVKFISSSGDNSDHRRDYLMGLVSACIAIFCFFAVWILLVQYLKCRGRWETGILRIPPRPEKSDEDNMPGARSIPQSRSRSLAEDEGERIRSVRSQKIDKEAPSSESANVEDIIKSGDTYPTTTAYPSVANDGDNHPRSRNNSLDQIDDETSLILLSKNASRQGPLDIDYQGLHQEQPEQSRREKGTIHRTSTGDDSEGFNSELAAIPSRVDSTDESGASSTISSSYFSTATPSDIASSYYFKSIPSTASSSSSLMPVSEEGEEKKDGDDSTSDCTPRRSNRGRRSIPHIYSSFEDEDSDNDDDATTSSAGSSDISSLLLGASAGLMYNASSASAAPAIHDIQDTIPEEMSDHSVPSPVAEGLASPPSSSSAQVVPPPQSSSMIQSQYNSPALQRKRHIEQYISQRKLLQEQSVEDVSVERGGWKGGEQESDNFLQFNASGGNIDTSGIAEPSQASPTKSKSANTQAAALSTATVEEAPPKDYETSKTKIAMEDYDQKLMIWEQEVKNTSDHHRKLQVGILFCSLCVIVASVLFSLKGTEILLDSVQDERDHLNMLESKLAASMNEVAEFERNQLLVKNTVDALLESINVHCPNIRPTVCDDIDLGLGCNFTGLPLDSQMLDFVENFGKENTDIAFRELGLQENQFETLISYVESSEESAGQFEVALWIASACTTVLAVLSIVMFSIVILGMKQKQSSFPYGLAWFRSNMLFPLLFIFLVIAFLSSMVFIIGSTASGDFCNDSPNAKISAFLDQLNPRNGDVYELMKTYVNGCTANDLVKDRLLKMSTFLAPATRFSNEANLLPQDSIVLIEEMCGAPLTTVQFLSKSLDRSMCVLTSSLQDLATDTFACEDWYLLYEQAAYESICYTSISGFIWAASCQFVILVAVFLLWTCRAGLFPVLEVGEEDETACRCFPGFVPKEVDTDPSRR